MAIQGTNVGTTYLDVRANTTPYKKELKGLGGVAGKIGKAIGGAFAVAGLVKFGKACTDLASDLNEVNNVTGKAFAGMQKQVDEWAKGATSAYGLSETMAKSYAGTFGAMAGSFGFTTKEAFKMSTTLAGLAGDVASFYNTSQDEAFTKLKSVFTGETESLKGLGVVMTQTALNQYALANGFGKTVQQMTEAEKVSLRYAFVLNQLKFAQGDFANTLGSSWANQIRVLKLNFDTLKATIGQSLIAVLMPVVKMINTILAGLTVLAKKFNNFFSALTGIKMDESTAQVSANLGDAGANADGLASGLDDSTGSANKASKAVGKLKRQLMGFDKITKLEANVDTGGGSSGGGGSVGGGGSLGISGKEAKTLGDSLKKIKLPANLVKAFESLKKAFSGLLKVGKNFGSYVWEKVLKPLGKWTLKKLAPVLVELLASAIELVTEALKTIKPIAKFIWEKILVPVGKFLGNLLIKYLEWCVKKFQVMTKTLKLLRAGISFLYDKYIKPFIDKYAPKVKKALSTIADFLKKAFLNAIGKVVEKVSAFVTLWDSIKDKAVELVADAKEKVDGALELLSKGWEAIQDKTAELKAEVKQKWEEIKGAWEGLVGKAQGVTRDIKAQVGTVWDTIKNTWNGLMNSAQGVTRDVKAQIGTVWETIQGTWNTLMGKAKGVTRDIKAQVGTTWESIKSTWEGFLANFKDKTKYIYASIGTAWNDLKKKWEGLLGNFKNKTKYIYASIGSKWNDLKSTWNGLLDHFKNKTVSLFLKLSTAGQDLKNWVNTHVIDKVNAHIPEVLKKMGLTIPHLAQGGFVARNTPQLAVIGDNTREGEIVAPESKLQAMADRASQSKTDPQVVALLNSILTAINEIDTNAYIDGKAITDVIVKQINRNTRSTGRLAIEV